MAGARITPTTVSVKFAHPVCSKEGECEKGL